MLLSSNEKFNPDEKLFEIHLSDGSVEQFQLMKYDRKKYLQNKKCDYQRLRLVLDKCIEEFGMKTDEEYQFWIDAIVNKNYEGFDDTFATLKMCDNERESVCDDETLIFEKGFDAKLNYKTQYDNNDLTKLLEDTEGKISKEFEKIQQEKDEGEQCYALAQKFLVLSEEEIQTGDAEMDPNAFKKKKKKRRTRQDRRKKEQDAIEKEQEALEKLQKVENPEQYWTNQEEKFEIEILQFLKKGEIFTQNDKRFTIIEMTPERTYYGEINDKNEPDGLCKISLPDKRYYFGEFQKSIINRKLEIKSIGKFKHPGHQVYYGEFENFKFNGKGICTYYCSGDRYDGQWKDDKKHGTGKCIWTDGSNYDGQWENNRRNGKGEYTYADGDIYIGGFKDDRRHGKGEYINIDGGNYIGEYMFNEANGSGVLTYANGDKYIGEFKDDKKHGIGKMISHKGNVTAGIFKDNDLVTKDSNFLLTN